MGKRILCTVGALLLCTAVAMAGNPQAALVDSPQPLTKAQGDLQVSTGSQTASVDVPASAAVSVAPEAVTAVAGPALHMPAGQSRGGNLVYSNTIDPTYWYYSNWEPPLYAADDVTLAGTDRIGVSYELGLLVNAGTMNVTMELWSGSSVPEVPITGGACTVTGLTGGAVTATCTLPVETVVYPDSLWVLFQKGAASSDHGIWITNEAEVGDTDDVFCKGTPGSWSTLWFGGDPYAGFWIEMYAETVQQTCGNNIREGTEECDGTDDVNCPGECLADCTCPYQPCDLICPPAADLEQEPCDDSGLNRLNDGCNMDPGPPVFEPITCGETVCGTGWSLNDSRDTDWYEVVVANDTVFTLTFEAEFTALFGLIEYNEGDEGSGSCGDISGYVTPASTVPKCTVGTVVSDCLPAGTYWFFVGAAFGSGDWPCGAPNYENDYHITLDCQTCVVPECPANTLIGQPPHLPEDAWSAGTSDAAINLKRFENFEDLYGDLCDLHWWGLSLEYDDTLGWLPCTEDPMDFTIEVYADDPSAGAVPVQTYTVSLTPMATGTMYNETYPLYYFSTTLSPCVPNGLYNGWISIQSTSVGVPDCYFLWMSAPMGDTGDLASLVYDGDAAPGEEWTVEDYDLSMCLTGTFIEPTGACCAEWFPGTPPECFDGIQLTVCNQQPSWRFAPDQNCTPDPFTPPCGDIYGACCFPGLTQDCAFLPEADCIAQGGEYQGDWTECEPVNPCPCILECPAGSVAELEPCGSDTNGGCNNDNPPYTTEPINCGDTVCGTSYFDGGTRDTDWFEVTIAQDGILTWTVVAEFAPQPLVINAGSLDCVDYTVVAGDAGNPCEEVSFSVSVLAGDVYWLWMGPDFDLNPDGVLCGDGDLYYATVECTGPCDVTCPPGSAAEGEVDCYDDYVDLTNSGCNDDTGLYPFGMMACNSTMCGAGGNYTTDGGTTNTRDTDWFELVIPSAGDFDFSVEAEFALQILLIDPGNGCAVGDYTILAAATAAACDTATISGTIDAGTYWLWIGTTDFAGWPCGSEWVATVACGGGCPTANIDTAVPPDGTIDARQNHPSSALTPCLGIGMAADPITICLDDPAATGACDCFTLCETVADANCGPNSIAACNDLGNGCYELTLDHGIAAPAVTTIQYNGGDYVSYTHHPANADGSSVANLSDVIVVIDNITATLGGSPTPVWVTDIDASGAVSLTDLLVEIDLLNGANAFDVWLNSPLPDPAGCP